jgi:hypothetical protein
MSLLFSLPFLAASASNRTTRDEKARVHLVPNPQASLYPRLGAPPSLDAPLFVYVLDKPGYGPYGPECPSGYGRIGGPFTQNAKTWEVENMLSGVAECQAALSELSRGPGCIRDCDGCDCIAMNVNFPNFPFTCRFPPCLNDALGCYYLLADDGRLIPGQFIWNANSRGTRLPFAGRPICKLLPQREDVGWLIRNPEKLCSAFGMAPKPYWLIVVKIVVTQAMLGMLFGAKKSNWATQHPKRYQLYYIWYQYVSALLSFAAVFATFSSSTLSGWEIYQRYAYLLAQSSGLATLIQNAAILQAHRIQFGSSESSSGPSEDTDTAESNSSSSLLTAAPCQDNPEENTRSMWNWLHGEYTGITNGEMFYPLWLQAFTLCCLAGPFVTHVLPIMVMYIWLVIMVSGTALTLHKCASSAAYLNEPLTMLAVTSLLTFFGSTLPTYCVIIYSYQASYIGVFGMEYETRGNYFNCLQNEITRQWPAAADFLGLF